MGWDQRRIEKLLRDQLVTRYGATDGDNRFSLYLRARQKLVEEVIPNIPGAEPSLTDHGERHLANVLDNAYNLVYGDEPAKRDRRKRLNATELYVLCLSILFHDVGNVYERRDHEKQVGKIYDWVRASEIQPNQERLLVIRVAGAHSGKSASGSRDTIGDLYDSHMWDEVVRMKEVAAILRFADELAEGEQRTSQFMQHQQLYDAESKLYHSYANVTTIQIDRGNGRVAITYNLEIASDVSSSDTALDELRHLLEFTYHRIVKLDQERQYCRHYAAVLEPFRRTEVSFNFWHNAATLPVDLPPLSLSGKVVPGETTRSISSINPQYDIETVCQRIKSMISGEHK